MQLLLPISTVTALLQEFSARKFFSTLCVAGICQSNVDVNEIEAFHEFKKFCATDRQDAPLVNSIAASSLHGPSAPGPPASDRPC